MALTSIFQEIGIDLEGELSVELYHTDTYDERNLIRMGCRREGQRWVRHFTDQEEHAAATAIHRCRRTESSY